MCGIAGFVDLRAQTSHEALRRAARAMADTLRHRGPDDAGEWVEEASGVALGFRRLAIIDLTPTGAQPMASADERFVIVCNGEIYNFRALRARLEAEGVGAWRGTSDTEVLLAAVSRWGFAAALRELNGMFAIALFDRSMRVLYLARDRMGEKPLYYGRMGNSFLFGSELKALAANADFAGEIDRDALGLYVEFDCVPGSHSIFRGIRKLLPGHVLSLRLPYGGTVPESTPFWDARAVAERTAARPFAGSDEAAADRLDALLRDSVSLRCQADVPVGVFLSGGVDSSVVAAAMCAESSTKVMSFSIGFLDAAFDEAPFAKRVAAHLGTEHTELYVTGNDARALLPRLASVYDEPFADSSQLPTMILSQLTRKHATVALTGDGGDELFAGYPRHARFVREWDARDPSHGGKLMSWFAKAIPFGDKLHHAVRRRDVVGAAALFRQYPVGWRGTESVVIGAQPAASLFESKAALPRGLSTLGLGLFLDVRAYLPDDLLVKVDRASMATGLEARAPLLDHRLVEFAWSLPDRLKLSADGAKFLLRQVLYRYVPRALLDRPKHGFEAPLANWLRSDFRPWAEALLDPSRLQRDGYFHGEPIMRRWAEHCSGQRSHHRELWNILMFQAWHDAFKDGRFRAYSAAQ